MAEKKKRARLNELLAMNDADLNAAAAAAHKAVYQFHKERLSKPQENVKIVKTSRKEVARILTIQRQHQLAAQERES